MRAPTPRMPFRGTNIRLNLLGFRDLTIDPMFLAQLLARQWDQLEFDRGYGKRDGRDTEDDITKKVKVKLLIYRRLDPKAFSIWLSDMDDYLISMKCQNMSGSICQDEVSWTSQNLLEQH